MKSIMKFPVEVHAGFLKSCPLASREYEILKNALVQISPAGQSVVEILCEEADARALLERATESYSAAMPYLKKATPV